VIAGLNLGANGISVALVFFVFGVVRFVLGVTLAVDNSPPFDISKNSPYARFRARGASAFGSPCATSGATLHRGWVGRRSD
jgi:hypothetical protein